MDLASSSRKMSFHGSEFGLLLFGMVLLSAVSRAESQADLLGTLLRTVADGVYESGDMELLDHICQYTRTPYIRRFQLHYRATVKCPGWTPIIGKAEGRRNPAHAERDATKDFVRQALEAGLVTREEAKNWL
ncbi:hypothetical protein SK128_027830 [Halocaridina rubra]|uniref:Anti-lipopolysaccharide factor n=1 Tax=Halocaridina rubra TaxID=373956 RepID=A0AAN8WY94_HALRR